ncbi:VWA domain-containing protein [Shewanella sp. SM34]|uniref:VWA domain-containing protein n=1 Tax=unclassified Shewanella TaxID=196818 RepID=UPI0021D832ED|nr:MULTISPECIES: VWA domain-containing protein [unclassified Shewanella]MCU8056066.1 VWA domain-containing protein [Shewanella sp. SM35]MCU8065000.1 VWA domain-containing protein [Shewanella sp. SM34]
MDISSVFKIMKPGSILLRVFQSICMKSVKYFIDSKIRQHVTPVPGSVLYCDLWVAVEHSGIYVGDGKISNIVVDGIAESSVSYSSAADFTSKSILGRKIYVSCNKDGAVGNSKVAHGADNHIGERVLYGYFLKNCHQFSTKCINYTDQAPEQIGLTEKTFSFVPPLATWEPTLAALKNAARKKLGTTKWRLWDWDKSLQDNPAHEPDWQAQEQYFQYLPLNEKSIELIRSELNELQDYQSELEDENIPQHITKKLTSLNSTLTQISDKYEEVKEFLAKCPGADFSYTDIINSQDDFTALARLLHDNQRIKDLAHKMGRNYISEEKKKATKIPEASKNEVHGTHRSNDLMRMLPSELVNLEDETLEVLFYARLLEHNLLTYELQGVTYINGEEQQTSQKRTGPVVACLDTSGSMAGAPLLKAKASLLAIANILKQEQRSLHVLLFGSNGELKEFSMNEVNNSSGLLSFLQQSFGGGTDFETPLKRALEIIKNDEDFIKADILMISDGDCILSTEFIGSLDTEKNLLDCSIYSVLCDGKRVEDNFSDEIILL